MLAPDRSAAATSWHGAAPKDGNACPSSSGPLRFVYPPSLRLKEGWEFDTLFRTGSRLKGKLVRLLFLEAPDGRTRYGLAVGKRIAKAHDRSRGRRLLKEAVRRLHPWVKPGKWMVLSLNEAGLRSRGQEVYFDIADLMKQRRLLNDDWPGPRWP